MTRYTNPRNGLADQVQRSSQRLASRGQIARTTLTTPARCSPIPPGHERVVVNVSRPDGSFWDQREARAFLAERPYASALEYRGQLPGRGGEAGQHVFSYPRDWETQARARKARRRRR